MRLFYFFRLFYKLFYKFHRQSDDARKATLYLLYKSAVLYPVRARFIHRRARFYIVVYLLFRQFFKQNGSFANARKLLSARPRRQGNAYARVDEMRLSRKR